jgi:hypothetical protein
MVAPRSVRKHPWGHAMNCLMPTFVSSDVDATGIEVDRRPLKGNQFIVASRWPFRLVFRAWDMSRSTSAGTRYSGVPVRRGSVELAAEPVPAAPPIAAVCECLTGWPSRPGGVDVASWNCRSRRSVPHGRYGCRCAFRECTGIYNSDRPSPPHTNAIGNPLTTWFHCSKRSWE